MGHVDDRDKLTPASRQGDYVRNRCIDYRHDPVLQSPGESIAWTASRRSPPTRDATDDLGAESAVAHHAIRVERVDRIERHGKNILQVEEQAHASRTGVPRFPVPGDLGRLILHQRRSR